MHASLSIAASSRAALAGLGRALLVAAALIGLWQALVSGLDLQPYILPPPGRVLGALRQHAALLAEHAGTTLLEMLLGLVLGAALGAATAVAMAALVPLRRVLLPLLVISQALPVFALAPLLVVWLGYGLASKIVMTTLITFFPVASACLDGLRRADPALVELGEIYGASRVQALALIRLPSALPALGSGLRIAAAAAPIGAVVGEWVGAASGLGFLMLQANARMQTDLMFAALALLALSALALRALVAAATRRLAPWSAEDP